MKQSFRLNENFSTMNNLSSDESRLYNQNCDLPLPPPPPHILALSNQYDPQYRTDSPYLMPPPPSLLTLANHAKPADPSDSLPDSIVPPPMPIINPPPRQSPITASTKTKASNLVAFCTTIHSTTSLTSAPASQAASVNAAIAASVTNNISNINSSKLPKLSPPIAVPPRVSSFITTTKPSVKSSSNETSNNTSNSSNSNSSNSNSSNSNSVVSILKQKSLPPLHVMNNKNPVSLANTSYTTGSSANSGSSEISGLSSASSRDLTYCTVCGQTHEISSNHIYSYRETVDSDLLCQICKQPLVDPLETKCGHTFCTACLKSHLVVQALCPEDKQIINFLECCPASIIVKRLLDKLLILCPNCDGCDEVMPRSELEAHLLYWCRAIPSQSNNLSLGNSFQPSKSSPGNNKWDCAFEKSPNTTSTTVTISSTNSGPLNEPSGSSTAVNTCEDPISVSSSPHEISNIKNTSRSSGATGTNHHKNTVRFDAMPQSRRKNYSVNEEHSISNDSLSTIIIDRSSNSDLGISFVGGSDTPLQCIVLQEIYLDGAVAKDGRLRPGDQIISINDIDLNQATHMQARHAFLQAQQQPGPNRLIVYRERADESVFAEKEEILQFCLSKRADKKLGIKLVGQKNKPGLYVLDLVKGSEADLDGRLRKNDRILNINGVDLRLETQDTAARVINSAEDEVVIIVSRIIRPQTPDLIRTTGSELIVEPFESACSTNNFSPPSGISRKVSGAWVSNEKTVTVEKNYGESLGMSVAGGVNSQRGDTPVYVTNLAVDGVLARTQQVSKGDILLAVNDTELLGLSHEKAVEELKSTGQKCKKVSVRLLAGPETAKNGGHNFLPSWVYWLQLPKYCEIPRTITLRRDSATGSLGFSIVGGIDTVQQSSPGRMVMNNNAPGRLIGNPYHQSIVVKSIVAGSVAHRNGRLKCGDILLKVNSTYLTNVSHDDAVSLFKNVQDEVVLQFVSWPGTIV